MAEGQQPQPPSSSSPFPLSPSLPLPDKIDYLPPPSASPRTQFNPSRMIGIIRRKSLIKELAAVYHAECLSYCQELLELQKKWEASYPDVKSSDDLGKETRPRKRMKKSRR